MASGKLMATVLKTLERFWESGSQQPQNVGDGLVWRNVCLKPAAFDGLGLALAVTRGTIARVHVSVVSDGEMGGMRLRVELDGIDVILGEVGDDDACRKLSVERQHRLATLFADTRARITRLIGSLAAGSVLSHGVMGQVFGQVLARVSIVVQNAHFRLLGGAADGGSGEENCRSQFVLGIVCRLFSVCADGECASVSSFRAQNVVLEDLSVYWLRGPHAHTSSAPQPPVSSAQPHELPAAATAPIGALVLLQPLHARASLLVERVSHCGPVGDSALIFHRYSIYLLFEYKSTH